MNGFFRSRSMVAGLSQFLDVIEFLQVAVGSNWFGLACPHHCAPSSFPTIALSFLLGLSFGLFLGCFLTFRIIHLLWSGLESSSPTSAAALSRLRGYLA